ncbi:MAG: acyl-CoA dehydrogenase family protein, partial [Acidimicrobiales bacterium]
MAITERRPTTDEPASDEEQMLLDRVEKLLSEHDPSKTEVHEFLGARFDAGLAWVWFPEGHGGLGLTPRLQVPVERALRDAKAPSMAEVNVIGYGMGAPTVLTHASEEVKRRLLRPLFTGEEIWCQLFSEPGAGSDVAGLATSAVKDGDEWVVNGQKVWTTLAHMSKWGMLLARTDPNVPKHNGLTYFVVDMKAPGVEVRPLRQLTGHAEFNEVFFTDVRIPDGLRLDAVGAGWRVAMTTLMNERVALGGGVPAREAGPVHQAMKVWKDKTDKNPVDRD